MTRSWLKMGKWSLMILGALVLSMAFNSAAFAQEESGITVDELARSINTVWLLVAAFLVFFMQAGFALLESGSTRMKNTVNILMKNLLDFSFASVSFWAIGWALMYGTTAGGFIGTDGFFFNYTPEELSDTGDVPLYASWFFQLVFAGTAATIVSGAVAERTKFISYIVFSIVITAIIYPIFGHWTWGGGWLAERGFSDFAGSTIVHSVGGWAALMGAIILGPRIGRFDKDGRPQVLPAHSVTLIALGTFILWLGWFGFNPGSQLAAATFADADAIALVAVTTNIAAAAGVLGALTLSWLTFGKPSVSFSLNGALGGLVAITAPCAVVTPLGAIIIGLVGGAIVVGGTKLLESFKIDDPVGAVPVHLMAGAWGTLALGLFATDSGLLYGHGAGQLVAQLIGIIACAVWAGGTSFILFKLVDITIGMRVSPEEEERGLDLDEHDVVAYPDITAMTAQIAKSSAGGTVSGGVSRAPAK